MIRGLFKLLCALSLLLLALTLFLWVRGHFAADQAWLMLRDGGSEMLRSERGVISLRHTLPNGRESLLSTPQRITHWSFQPGSQLPPGKSRLHWRWRFVSGEGVPAATSQEIIAARQLLSAAPPPTLPPIPRPFDPTPSVTQSARNVLDGKSYREISFPAWLAAVAFAIPPAAWLSMRPWHRRRRLRKGLCPACGYDLRATPGHCPECGWSAANPA
jgi:hypothetical protein